MVKKGQAVVKVGAPLTVLTALTFDPLTTMTIS